MDTKDKVTTLEITKLVKDDLAADIATNTENIATNTENIATNTSDISELKEGIVNLDDTKANKTALAVTDRKLDALWKMNEGQTYQIEDVSETSYVEDIPSGSQCFSADELGGKSLIWNQHVYSGNVFSIDSDNVCSLKANIVGAWGERFVKDILTSAGSFIFTTHYFAFVYKYISGTVGTNPLYLINANNDAKQFVLDTGTHIKVVTSNSYSFFTRIQTSDNSTVSDYTDLKCIFNVFDITLMTGIDATNGTADEAQATFEALIADVYKGYSYNAGEIIHAPVDKITSKNADGTELFNEAIPSEIQALEGYGWSNNVVNFESKVFSRAVESEAIGDDGTLIQTLYDEPVETDISAYLDGTFDYIPCESGGTITYHHENGDNGTLIPSVHKNSFVEKLSEVSK